MKYYLTLKTPVDSEESISDLIAALGSNTPGYELTCTKITAGKPVQTIGSRGRLYTLLKVHCYYKRLAGALADEIWVEEFGHPVHPSSKFSHKGSRDVSPGDWVVCYCTNSKRYDPESPKFEGLLTLSRNLKGLAVFHSRGEAINFIRIKVNQDKKNKQIEFTGYEKI